MPSCAILLTFGISRYSQVIQKRQTLPRRARNTKVCATEVVMNSLLNLTSQDLVNLNADVAASSRGRNRAERAGRCERSIMHDCLGSFACAAAKPIADEWPMGDADRNVHAASQPTRSGKHQEWNSKLIENTIVANVCQAESLLDLVAMDSDSLIPFLEMISLLQTKLLGGLR